MKFLSLVIATIFAGALGLFQFNQIQEAVAQGTTLVCVNADSQALSWPDSSGKCGSNLLGVNVGSIPANFKAVCVAYLPKTKNFGVFDASDKTGKTTCSDYEGKPDTYQDVKLVNRSAITGTLPAKFAGTSGGTTGGTKGTGTTPGNPKPKPKDTNGTSTSGTGDCPDKFTAKGPICVPNNPFDNGDGIAGKGTVGELAAEIISILLYIAGIVAVIMVIYGGYVYMTARGSEDQAKSGRKTLVNALIGLVIVIVSFGVVQALTNYLTDK